MQNPQFLKVEETEFIPLYLKVGKSLLDSVAGMESRCFMIFFFVLEQELLK